MENKKENKTIFFIFLLMGIFLCIMYNYDPKDNKDNKVPLPTQQITKVKNTIVPIITYSQTISDNSIIECKNVSGMAGDFVTCKISRAYCEFHPEVNGDPTFCNDAPYPNHGFTLVVFGQDWSDYNGMCLVINGALGYYDGKPQVFTKNRARVTECP